MHKTKVEGYPLSPQQKHIWLLQQFDRSNEYRSVCEVLIEGALDVTRLKKAIEQVISRHEIFRTTFQSLPGMPLPLQIVSRAGLENIEEVDLAEMSFEDQQASLESFFAEARKTDFDRMGGPLVYVSLITLSQIKHVLLINMPSILGDAHTLKNLIQDLTSSYDAPPGNKYSAHDLAQYADLSVILNDLLVAEETELGRSYWSSQSIGELENLRLPLEKQPEQQGAFRTEYITFEISTSMKRLRSLALRCDTHISVIIQACWQVLLWRLLREQAITVGVLHDGRKYDELKEAMGPFASYLPIKCEMGENLSFREVLDRIKQATQEAYEWQECFS